MDTKENKVTPKLYQQIKNETSRKSFVVNIDIAPTTIFIMNRLKEIKEKLDAFDEKPAQFKNAIKSSST